MIRFDGNQFDTFRPSDGLPHLNVTTIAEAQDGQMLFGTLGGGLAAFNGQGFQVYTTEHGLPSNDILSLHPQTDGSVRVMTRAGIGYFVEGHCVDCMTDIGGQPLGAVYDYSTDATGTTWLATRERGVISLEGQSMPGDLNIGEETMRWPWKFASDPAGYLWIAFRYVGSEAVVGRYDPQHRQLDLVTVDRGVESAEMVQQGTRHVRLDNRGWLWVTHRGVFVYDGQAWHPFSARFPDIHFSDTRLTYEDREGNIWVGLWGGGLVCCDPVSVQLYTKADGLPDSEVQCLSEDGMGRLWIGTLGGLACWEGDQIRLVETEHTVSALIADAQRSIWSSSSKGQVSKWKSKAVQVIAMAEVNFGEEITALCLDGHGRVWVGTSQGRLGWIEAGRLTVCDDQLPHECKTVLSTEDGGLWIGTAGNAPALYRYEDGQFRTSGLAELDAASEVYALCQYQGRLWVGTANHGLFALDLSSQQVCHFTTERGLLSVNGILSLTADPQHKCMWIGTSGGGVLKYDGHTFLCIQLGNAALENVVEDILRDSRGQLWFGTRAGLVAYQPSPVPPSLVIRQVMAGHLFKFPQVVSCTESTPEVHIHFQGISFRTKATQMRYSHRLVGHAPAAHWSEFTPVNTVSYNDLPAGQFRFEVRALNRDGLLSATVCLAVRVLPESHNTRLQSGPQSMLNLSLAMSRIMK